MALDNMIKAYEAQGCRHADRLLGFQKMPPGYALMLDPDEIYFFWLCSDGSEGAIHWNKWAVRAAAIANSKSS